MNQTKALFGLLIIFLTVLILFVSAFYTEILESQKSTLRVSKVTGLITLGIDSVIPKESTLNYINSNLTCNFDPPTEKTIILRLDDLGAWHYHDTVKKMTKEVMDRDLSYSLAVIPEGLARDDPFIDWINSVKDNPRIEIALHGYAHEPNEFKDLNAIQAYNLIIKGKEEIITNLHIEPVTFIPPSNEYNEGTILALKEAGFKIISARNSEFGTDGGIIYLGADAKTADYFEKRFIPVDEVLTYCEVALEEKNLCIITIHPQDYVLDEDHGRIDDVKYAEYIRLLDELKARAYQSKTFKDLIQCQDIEDPMQNTIESLDQT